MSIRISRKIASCGYSSRHFLHFDEYLYVEGIIEATNIINGDIWVAVETCALAYSPDGLPLSQIFQARFGAILYNHSASALDSDVEVYAGGASESFTSYNTTAPNLLQFLLRLILAQSIF